jgi:hypothetical protein
MRLSVQTTHKLQQNCSTDPFFLKDQSGLLEIIEVLMIFSLDYFIYIHCFIVKCRSKKRIRTNIARRNTKNQETIGSKRNIRRKRKSILKVRNPDLGRGHNLTGHQVGQDLILLPRSTKIEMVFSHSKERSKEVQDLLQVLRISKTK